MMPLLVLFSPMSASDPHAGAGRAGYRILVFVAHVLGLPLPSRMGEARSCSKLDVDPILQYHITGVQTTPRASFTYT